MSAKWLITGATGFIGQRLCERATRDGVPVVAAVRQAAGRVPAGVDTFVVGEINGNTHWEAALEGIDTVIHLAGRAHIVRETAQAPLEAFRTVNLRGTQALFEAAVAAGVRRFVNMSSIGVLGQNSGAAVFDDATTPRPVTPYGVSKLEAEQSLAALSAGSSVQCVSLRPPLVYGPGNGGNFLRLLDIVAKGMPLPLGMAHGLRDMIGVDNLVDIIMTCARHDGVVGHTYGVRDGEPVSTADLFGRLAHLMGRPARLLPVPAGLLGAMAGLLGRREDVQRLFSPLRIDDSSFRRDTGWQPVCTLDHGLAQTVRWYLDR